MIVNAGFETLATAEVGQLGEGIVPAPWIPVALTPDTYSTDGQFGLDPTVFGNFTGVTPHTGVRWAAAWGAADERFGQVLAAPLTAGKKYVLSLYLHMAVRADLAIDSTYAVGLAVQSAPTSDVVEVGTFANVTTGGSWQARSITFTAPTDAANRKLLVFRSVTGYAGMDDVSLTECP
ncbi:MAG: hypothetical protein HS104_19040 [Polyangiaceae bacterium]|nr:hypothetical protein [Polyangiaceae bacterium]MCL4752890.1 hypothetical protein [Myxococcales bacterium]